MRGGNADAAIHDAVADDLSAGSPRFARDDEPLKGLRLLDVGSGGGLISEPMARLGASVTGVDASEKNISVASLHAEKSGLDIDYRCTTAEELASTHPAPGEGGERSSEGGALATNNAPSVDTKMLPPSPPRKRVVGMLRSYTM